MLAPVFAMICSQFDPQYDRACLKAMEASSIQWKLDEQAELIAKPYADRVQIIAKEYLHEYVIWGATGAYTLLVNKQARIPIGLPYKGSMVMTIGPNQTGVNFAWSF